MTAQTRSEIASSRRLLPWTPVVLAAVAFTALIAYHRFHLGDDSFIYFRYVANVVAGHGAVWNVGEPPVEGYSSPLWLGLLSLGVALGSDVVQWARWLGIFAAGAALVGVWFLARRLGAGVAWAGIATLVAGLIRGLHYWAPVGLESPLDTALMVWTCALLADPDRGRAWVVPMALLGIARPEGPFLVVVGLVAAAIARGWREVTWREIAILAAPAVAWEVFRIAYYGVPLPNTYYAKATGTWYRQLRLGARYGGWLAIPIAIALAGWPARAPRRPAQAILLLLTGQLAVAIGGGGDWMTNHRLLLPVLLPLLGCAAGLAARPGVGAPLAILVTALTGLPVVTSTGTMLAALQGQTLPLDAWQEGSLVTTSREAGAWIGAHYPAGTMIAVNHAGVVPYGLLDFRTIDMTGLNDAHIAREVPGGLHQKFDPDYVLARRPRLVLLNSHVEPGRDGIWYHRGYWEGETALVDRLEFQRWYRPVRYWTRIGRHGSPAYILLYERAAEPIALLRGDAR